MAEPTFSAGDTPCQCTRPELSEFSWLLEASNSTASKGEIIRSWLAVLVYFEVRSAALFIFSSSPFPVLISLSPEIPPP